MHRTGETCINLSWLKIRAKVVYYIPAFGCDCHTSWLMKFPSSIRRLPSFLTISDLSNCLSICVWYSSCLLISCSRSLTSPPTPSPVTRDSVSLSQPLRHNQQHQCKQQNNTWKTTRERERKKEKENIAYISSLHSVRYLWTASACWSLCLRWLAFSSRLLQISSTSCSLSLKLSLTWGHLRTRALPSSFRRDTSSSITARSLWWNRWLYYLKNPPVVV